MELDIEVEQSAPEPQPRMEACKRAIRSTASLGKYYEHVHDEGNTYNLELKDVNIRVEDIFSYDEGPFYGIYITSTTPEGKFTKDSLVFVGHNEKPVVRFSGEERRPATEDDITIFESFLTFTHDIAESEKAEKERIRLEKEEQERARLARLSLGLDAYYVADAAIKFKEASLRVEDKIQELLSKDGERAHFLDEMSDEELIDLLIDTVKDNQYLSLFDDNKEAVKGIRTMVQKALRKKI